MVMGIIWKFPKPCGCAQPGRWCARHAEAARAHMLAMGARYGYRPSQRFPRSPAFAFGSVALVLGAGLIAIGLILCWKPG